MALKNKAEERLTEMMRSSDKKTDEKYSLHSQVVSNQQDNLALLRTINKVLVLGIIAAAVLLGIEVKRGAELLSQDVEVSLDQKITQPALGMETLLPPVQRLSYYLTGPKRRNIFEAYQEPETKTAAETTNKDSNIANITKNLRLVGISWLDQVETASALIEDTQSKVTYFLRKDEKIGDIIVKTIYADSVSLGYQNEEILMHYDQSQM